MTYGYKLTGHPSLVHDGTYPGDPQLLWEVEARTAENQLEQARWGSPTGVPGQSPELRETRYYDPLLGRLGSIVTMADNTSLFYHSYEYDANGNVDTGRPGWRAAADIPARRSTR